eukprot:CAMPEP_0176481380 /NCGR_PEP_ID=MMETSP0200_2-20121128/2789_1 /TAXON_ID=947934 /ORGANISM="Chaetoceros sp., Strain GSL56" /LENGTH=46 /DNA_ID= /DNA_START= /DNA_END= /DNA_ORIENTATION=
MSTPSAQHPSPGDTDAPEDNTPMMSNNRMHRVANPYDSKPSYKDVL